MIAEVLLRDGFGPQPMFHVVLAEVDHHSDGSDSTGCSGRTAVGMAFFFPTYDTWRGPTLFLEDLFVLPSHRGRGVGVALLQRLVTEARARGCSRLSWQVLDWNEPAIQFYQRKFGTIE